MNEQQKPPVITFFGWMIEGIAWASLVSSSIGIIARLLAHHELRWMPPVGLLLCGIPGGLICIRLGRDIRKMTIPVKGKENTSQPTSAGDVATRATPEK